MTNERFEFNQARLATFNRCQRRFYLKYRSEKQLLENIFVIEDPYRDPARLGQIFHLNMERLARGTPLPTVVEGLPPAAADSVAKAWEFRSSLQADEYLTEFELSVPFDRWRLNARADLIARSYKGSVTIVDWKTGVNIGRERLQKSEQALILPYIVLDASKRLGWTKLTALDIVLVFWFAQEPDQPLVLPYSDEQHEANRRLLATNMAWIESLKGEEAFARVPDDPDTVNAVCRPCEFLHYCERNPTSAGPIQSLDYEEEDLEAVWESLDFSHS